MTSVTIVGSIMLLVLGLFSWHTYTELKQYNSFQKEMKVGDNCTFYINDVRVCGKITAVFERSVVIEDYVDGDAHGVARADVYPPDKKIKSCTSR
jgi:hypothetical protein